MDQENSNQKKKAVNDHAASECCHGQRHQEQQKTHMHECCHDQVNRQAVMSGYTCPMHPEVNQDKAGDCPECGMALETIVETHAQTKTEYTCPMHPEIVRDKPGD